MGIEGDPLVHYVVNGERVGGWAVIHCAVPHCRDDATVVRRGPPLGLAAQGGQGYELGQYIETDGPARTKHPQRPTTLDCRARTVGRAPPSPAHGVRSWPGEQWQGQHGEARKGPG